MMVMKSDPLVSSVNWKRSRGMGFGGWKKWSKEERRDDDKKKQINLPLSPLSLPLHPQPSIVGSMPQLMVGSIGSAYSKDILIRHGVSHIITVGENIKPKFPEVFQYKVIPSK